MTLISKKCNFSIIFFYSNSVNCERFINYPYSCCTLIVTINHTSQTPYLQVIRGLNTNVIANRVLCHLWVIFLGHGVDFGPMND